MNPEHIIQLDERMRPKACKNLWGRAISSQAASLSLPLLNKKTTRIDAFLGRSKNGKDHPHDYPGHFVDERYLPDEISGTVFYFPTEEGAEKAISERLSRLWKGRYDSK